VSGQRARPTPDEPVGEPARRAGARVVEPLEVDAVRVMAAGTALWCVALVVLVLLRPTLDRHDAGWWVWVAVAGIGLGGIGLVVTTRRRTRLRADERVG
jgi:hypothetical protein